MKKNNFFLLKTILLSFILLLTFSNCKEKSRTVYTPADVSSFIYAYTSGVISKTSPIRIRFTKEVIGLEEVGTTVESNIFHIQPSVEGKPIWEDTRTLLFEATDPLQSGTAYQVSLALSELFEQVPRNIASFTFPFQTRALRYDLKLDGLRAANPNLLEAQTLHGTVKTADLAASELVEKGLVAKQNGKELPVSWQHLDGNTRHTFVVKGINRAKNPSNVEIDWNAKGLGISEVGDDVVVVPPLNEFKVVSVKVEELDNKAIIINFSDPLQKNQELKGLVSIANYKERLKFVIDGNLLKVYPASRVTGNQKVVVRQGVKNVKAVKMPHKSEWDIAIPDEQPQLRLVGKGTIMPNSNGLIFPFEAISLNAVDVEVLKIYDNNILQFLQTNALNGGYDMERVGRIILQEKINLKELDPTANPFKWSRYALDLRTLINDDPNAIYQIRLGFRPAYSLYNCGEKENNDTEGLSTFTNNTLADNGEIKSFWGDYYGVNGYYDGFEWRHRDNPCFPAYFNYDRFVKRNVLASDIGMIAKSGKDGSVMIAVSDIKSTQPLVETQLDFYDYQQQLIKTMLSDGDGMAMTQLERTPFAVIASKGQQKGYLRLYDPNALSLSRFDVDGAIAQKGLKGFIYGERGVWRPGDSIYLNFVLEDKTGKLPANHPINFELVDPRGQTQQQWVTSENIHNVYPIATQTTADAPTGNWMAKVKIGGASFSKSIRVETVKPNRLKIDLDIGAAQIMAQDKDINANLDVKWLHGAPAQNVKVRIEKQIRPVNTIFDQFKEYEFDDPARAFNAEPQIIYDKAVDANGKAKVLIKRNQNALFPGMCATSFNIRAFEKGGDFSSNQITIKESPYSTYTGVYIKKNKYGEKRLDIGKDGQIELIAVDENGKSLRGRNLKVGLYKIDWRWWWDRGNDNISKYNSAKHFGSIESNTLKTNAKGAAKWNINIDDWGRYLVRVCDTQSGHCSGDIFYAGYPWNDGDSPQNRDAASMLAFSADKTKYQVGEKIELSIPSSGDGRALISLENGSRVIESYWTDTNNGETKFSFYATEEMTPTVYANVSLIQPHAQVKNDLPIRLYGVIPLKVEDKATRLEPQLKMPESLESEQVVTVEVSENNGEAMTYTLAMVDDGLLDLTQFKTPNPWDNFYAREALGVKTWDIYDHVLGAYGGSLDRILAIGGDAALKKGKANNQANRFKPVVKHLGPFYLEKGQKAKHQIQIPNYIGSVRTMLVASNHGAYGSAEKTTPVKKPLMVLATLPRVLGPTEQLSLPVTVFSMDKKIKTVKVQVEETSGLVNVLNGNSQTINFSKPGEALVNFDIEVGEGIGKAVFKITANGNGEKASQEIEIQVRNPNPFVNDVQEKVLQPGQAWNTSFEALGIAGTNSGILEVSNIPPIDLGKRLNYLIRYPHGCIEQTTSAGFPQLYVSKLMEVDEARKNQITKNITATVDRLKQFQTTNGGFAYWPGDSFTNAWGSNYAGHFMLEAEKAGYALPLGVLNKWKKFQKRQAQNWNYGDNNYDNDLSQAYRLFTLALAGTPEIGAMNRLREHTKISSQAKWRLAAAYAQIGRAEVAEALIKTLNTAVKDYRELSYTYGSGLRDEAMILETLVTMKAMDKAGKIAKNIANKLSSGRWYGTQTVAYSLLAVGKFVGNTAIGDQYNFAYQVGNQQLINAGSSLPIMNIDVPVDGNSDKQILLNNTSKGVLYAKLILTGQPVIGDQTAKAENLKMTVQYLDLNGQKIDPSRLAQGTDFVAQIKVTNPGSRGIRYEEMALTQVFPSGWEILNTRMTNIQRFANSSKVAYQDVRDDRVYSYFDIPRKSTQTYTIQLNAAYEGRFYLPTVYCEAMYDNTINARQPGKWIEVIAPSSL
jgi:uncharacterized protein YfaS (alpha-2-macroglobulin family)